MSGDVLDRLADRHRSTSRRPACPRCNGRPITARLLLQVKRSKPKDGKRADETVVSSVRSMCAECAAELYEQFLAQLPDKAPGGRP